MEELIRNMIPDARRPDRIIRYPGREHTKEEYFRSRIMNTRRNKIPMLHPPMTSVGK